MVFENLTKWLRPSKKDESPTQSELAAFEMGQRAGSAAAEEINGFFDGRFAIFEKVT